MVGLARALSGLGFFAKVCPGQAQGMEGLLQSSRPPPPHGLLLLDRRNSSSVHPRTRRADLTTDTFSVLPPSIHDMIQPSIGHRAANLNNGVPLFIPILSAIAFAAPLLMECGSENNKSRFFTALIVVSLLQETNGEPKVNEVEKGSSFAVDEVPPLDQRAFGQSCSNRVTASVRFPNNRVR